MMNNSAYLVGKICSDVEFNHEVFGEKFYLITVCTERLSGKRDYVPVLLREKTANSVRGSVGRQIAVSGAFRSHNLPMDGKTKTVLALWAERADLTSKDFKAHDVNYVFLDGCLCKVPILRETPLGRNIADLVMAVNRSYGRKDYIPCICWNECSFFASSLPVGTRVIAEGRIQSREYLKKYDDGTEEIKTAYEVSIFRLTIHEKEETLSED